VERFSLLIRGAACHSFATAGKDLTALRGSTSLSLLPIVQQRCDLSHGSVLWYSSACSSERLLPPAVSVQESVPRLRRPSELDS
jgi:hypothetical protein